MHLLGLRADDVSACADACSASTRTNEDGVDGEAELRPLSARERNRARKMLERCSGCGTEERFGHQDRAGEEVETATQLRNELQVMLMLGVKAEIQVLDRRPGGLAGWLARKLRHY